MLRLHRDERGQSLVIVLSLITIMFLLGSSLAVHGSVALRSTRASDAQGDDFYAADAATELGIWWQRNGKAGNPPAQTINSVTTSTTITSAGGGGGCPTVAPIWLTGFEHGAVSASGGGLFDTVVTVGGTNVTAPAAAARTGGYGLRVQTTDIFSFGYARKNTTGAVRVARLSIQLPTLPVPATTDADLALFNASTGSALKILYQGSSQKLALRIGTGTPVEMSGTFSAGTWYSFDVRYNVSTNPRRAEWQLDGVAQTDVTSAEATATSVSSVQLGADSGTSSNMYFDDVMVSSTSADYPIGELSIDALALNGMGVSVNPPSFQHNDNTAISATTYTRLDETPMTSLVDYIKQVTANVNRYIEMTFADTTEECIRGVSAVLAYHGSATAANTGKTSIFVGATERIVYSGAMNVTALAYKSLVVSPITAPWTQAALNGLLVRVGYSTDINPLPYWDAVLLEYGWRTSPPATITVVGTGGGSTVTTDYTDAGAGVPTLDTWTVTK
ncbi:MAG: hypothetical protein WEF51_07830 [Chloroflexota bacterium]